jgi:hypothetical protein
MGCTVAQMAVFLGAFAFLLIPEARNLLPRYIGELITASVFLLCIIIEQEIAHYEKESDGDENKALRRRYGRLDFWTLASACPLLLLCAIRWIQSRFV